jgi:hypothetical protein
MRLARSTTHNQALHVLTQRAEIRIHNQPLWDMHNITKAVKLCMSKLLSLDVSAVIHAMLLLIINRIHLAKSFIMSTLPHE